MKKIFLLLFIGVFMNSVKAQSVAKTKPTNNTIPANTTTKTVTTGSSLLFGLFSGPAGSNVLLQNNGKIEVSVSAEKESGKNVSTSTFKFPTPLADSSNFKITIKKAPAAQTCFIYAGADGKMPQKENKLRVGCDFTYDLVSRSSNDAAFSSFYESTDAVVGGNSGEEGRYIAFISSSAGFAGASGKHRQVFWRDRNTGITKLISVSATGEEGNADSYSPAISADGKSVAFESYSSNLVLNDKNSFRDIFIWRSTTNKIELISIGEGGKDANAESYEPSLSADGNLIAFTSAASNISKTEKGVSNNNVFLRDMISGHSVMISIDRTTKKGGGGSRPSISYDGSRIAFYSNTSGLVANDNNGLWDIFLWDKNDTELKRVSMTADNKERNQGNESANRIVSPSISGNGRYIAFTTTAGNMTAGDVNGFQDVFVYDTKTGITIIASNGTNQTPGNGDSPVEQGEKIAISYDGKWIAFSTNATNLGVPRANILMHNIVTGENRPVSAVTGSSVGRPSISHSAGYVVFGIGGKLDNRFSSSGIFANYTGVGLCRSCPE